MSTVAQALKTLEAEFAPPQAGAQELAQQSAQASDEARQFVIFHIESEMFAVSLSEVQEIIRLPEVVRVPFSPISLEGLANLRGNVLPVLNLRRAFQFPQAMYDDSTRVVVLDHGRPIGLIVDRMANVVTVEAANIESADTIRAAIDTDLLTGIIKQNNGASMVMILDARQLIQREFQGVATLDKVVGAAQVAETLGADRHHIEAVVDEEQLVSFDVAGQEYAFPIERVQEIVQLPGNITCVPNSAGHILGVITLRNRLLPLVSLRGMFGLPPAEMSEANKVVVVSLSDDGTISVGVVMDSVREVLRVKSSQVEPMPELLSGGKVSEFTGVCRLQDGRRLVSVLSAQNMFDTDELAKLAKSGEADMATSQDIDARVGADSDLEEQFVLFRLMNEEYGVPIDAVQEIVRVPTDLTRIPRTPDFIEGVINLRGVVLPVVDQRRRFRLESVERNDRQRIMVFTIRGVKTGFIVDSVSEVRRIPAGAIGSAPDLSAEQKRIIRRVANLEAEKRMILLLDVLQLLNIDETDALASTRH
jgi:purine-binding chemotaxis protein CheW